MQRSDTVFVLMIHLRPMFNQHRHELDKPTMSSALQWRTATDKQRKTNKQYIKHCLRHAMISAAQLMEAWVLALARTFFAYNRAIFRDTENSLHKRDFPLQNS